MKTITLTAPEGFEFTGEFRYPKRGEALLGNDGNALIANLDWTESRYILRKLKPPMYWVHKNCLKVGMTLTLWDEKPKGSDEYVRVRLVEVKEDE